MRSIIFSTALLLTLITTTYGKGCSGTYFIMGTAYSLDKTALKNVTLTIRFGNETKSVLTDSSGHYEIELAWTNACPSGRLDFQHKRDNKKLNPQFIYVGHSKKEIKLENKWEKYAKCFPKSKESVTWVTDLNFISS